MGIMKNALGQGRISQPGKRGERENLALPNDTPSVSVLIPAKEVRHGDPRAINSAQSLSRAHGAGR